MLKHFVEFVYPAGIFFLYYERHTGGEVTERKHELVTVPERALGYCFYDQEQIVTDDGELLIGKRKNYSGFTYFGQAHTLEEFKQRFPETFFHIRNDNWIGAVETRGGYWLPLKDGDTVIE